MKSLVNRGPATLVVGALAVLLLLGATAPVKPGVPLQPDKVVILSTQDVKGKTSPCG